eukprot:2195457-Prymnesium_polylepis.1
MRLLNHQQICAFGRGTGDRRDRRARNHAPDTHHGRPAFRFERTRLLDAVLNGLGSGAATRA